MANNPFDLGPNYNSLMDIVEALEGRSRQPSNALSFFGVGNTSASPPAKPMTLGALGSLPPEPVRPVENALTGFSAFGPPPRYSMFDGIIPPSPPSGIPFDAPVARPAVKRKAFFSFHYDDIMRVNVVRNAWKIDHPDNTLNRSFYDSSLWESRKLDGDDALKRLIREGVEYTSAVCVLVGSETWLRRWVKYEIARAIIDGRGLLAVHLNSIRHHKTLTAHTRGNNPLDFMAVGKIQAAIGGGTRYYLYEKTAVADGIGGWKFAWLPYGDYTNPVALPQWLADPQMGYVTPLSDNAAAYDYIADNGHRNIGAWIDRAAHGAGR